MKGTIPHPELYDLPFRIEEFNGMPYRLLGSSGLRVSNVGLGLWKFGYPETGDGSRVDEKTAMAVFDRAIELGVTFWDTANRYNNASGNSERVIGSWLAANPDQRRNVIIGTKVFGAMDGRTPNHCWLSRANILDSVYACLERLRTDHIDLLYFHAYDPVTPVEESMAAVEDLMQRDMVRYFAVSNFTVDQVRLYQAVQQNLSVRCRIAAVQNKYDLLFGEQGDKAGVLDYCARSGVSFVAWSPLARGLLTERYLDVSKVGPGDRLYDEGGMGRCTPEVVEKLRRLAGLAHEWGLELQQLALAYMLALPGMGPVIPAVSAVRQLESNAAAGKVVLSDAQKSQIRAALAR